LRRAVPSFTVEVRRRPRLATHSSQDVQSSETKTRPAAFERESRRVGAATFGAAKTSNQPSSDGAASCPKGRILQSLVPEKPPGGQLQDTLPSAATSDPMSPAQKPPSGRALKGKDQTSKFPRTLEALSDLTAHLADRSSVAFIRLSGVSPSDGTAVSAGMPTATSNHMVGNSGGPVLRPKANRRIQIPIALDESLATASAKDQRTITRTDSLGTLPTAVDLVSRPNRKRTIIGRYVFGDELKPGERWKRRLSKGRRDAPK
jgi:hypothetical protein